MTDRLTALVALKETVTEGRLPEWRVVETALGKNTYTLAYNVIFGDLLAMGSALSLLAAVLPGRTWSLTALMGEDGVMFYRARIYLPYAGFVEATASNEARAFLLAIIAAKIEEERNAG